jgi:hypothetical protein
MDLERIAAPSRRRRRSWLAIPGAIAIVAGATGELRSRDEVHVVTLVRDKVIAIPITMPLLMTELASPPPPTPVVLPAPRGPRAVCPPPRRDAPMVTLPEFDDSMVEHVVPAPTNAGWIAAWGGTSLFVSYDAGASFTTAIASDDGASIDDVTFDCYGRVVVAGGGKLGVYAAGTLTWLVDYRGEFETLARHLIGGGPDIVMVNADDDSEAVRLEVSRDLGATWSNEVVWPAFDDRRSVSASGQQAADGTIRLVLSADQHGPDGDTGKIEMREIVARDGTISVDGTTALTGADTRDTSTTAARIRADRVSPSFAVAPTAPTIALAPGHIERYGRINLAAAPDGVWWRTDRRAWQRVDGLSATAQLVPGPWPAVVVGDGLYRIERGKPRRVLDWPAESGRTSTAPAAIDLAGRVWAIESRGGGDCDGAFEPVLLGRVAR